MRCRGEVMKVVERGAATAAISTGAILPQRFRRWDQHASCKYIRAAAAIVELQQLSMTVGL